MLEYPCQAENPAAESLLSLQNYLTLKYGKKIPQIYIISGIENGYFIAGMSYYATVKSRVSLSLDVVVQLQNYSQMHITIKRPIFHENPGKICRIIVLC